MREYIPSDALLIPGNAKLAFSGKIFDVYQWPQKLFDGTTETFEMLRRKDTVKTIAIKGDKIIITRQKQPRKSWFYDVPGGRNDVSEENELAAARRELLEETGMSFRTWRLVEVHQPLMKIDWLVYTFLATDFDSQIAQNLDGGELIEVQEVSFDELKNLAQTEPRLAHDSIIKNANSLNDLLDLPSLHTYKNSQK